MKNLLKFNHMNLNWKPVVLLLAVALILGSCGPAIKAGGDETGAEAKVSVNIKVPMISPALSSVLSTVGDGSKGLNSKAYLAATQVELILRDQGNTTTILGPLYVDTAVNSQNGETMTGASFLALPGAYRLNVAVYSSYSSMWTAFGFAEFVVGDSDTSINVIVTCKPNNYTGLFVAPGTVAASLETPWIFSDGIFTPGSEAWYNFSAPGVSTRVFTTLDTDSAADPILMVYDNNGNFIKGGQSYVMFTSTFEANYFVGVIDIGSGSQAVRGFTLSYEAVSENDPPTAASLNAPLNGSSQVHPANAYFEWVNNGDPDGNPSDVYFTLYYTTDETWTPINVNQYTTYNATSTSLNNLLAGSTYYWYVTATDGIDVATSVTNSFTTDYAPYAPMLYTPDEGATVDSMNAYFQWIGQGDPDPNTSLTYSFDITQDETWGSLSSSNLGAGLSTYQSLIQGATYYWRVRANDGILETTSAIQTVHANAAPSCVLGSPLNMQKGIDPDSVTFTWTGSDPNGTTPSYILQVATSADFESNLILSEFVGSSTQQDRNLRGVYGGALGTVYYWRVFAMDAFVSVPSAPQFFTTNYAPVAIITGPNSVNSGDTVTLSAASSYDNDVGETLTYYWYRNGSIVGEGLTYTTDPIYEATYYELGIYDSQGNYSVSDMKMIGINTDVAFEIQ